LEEKQAELPQKGRGVLSTRKYKELKDKRKRMD
jgi:hypothetical protein